MPIHHHDKSCLPACNQQTHYAIQPAPEPAVQQCQPQMPNLFGDVILTPNYHTGQVLTKVIGFGCGCLPNRCPEEGETLVYNARDRVWEYKKIVPEVNDNDAVQSCADVKACIATVITAPDQYLTKDAAGVLISKPLPLVQPAPTCADIKACIASTITSAGEVLTKNSAGNLISVKASKTIFGMVFCNSIEYWKPISFILEGSSGIGPITPPPSIGVTVQTGTKPFTIQEDGYYAITVQTIQSGNAVYDYKIIINDVPQLVWIPTRVETGSISQYSNKDRTIFKLNGGDTIGVEFPYNEFNNISEVALSIEAM